MRPEKHSLTIQRHRTSVTLELPFWEAFCAITAQKNKTLNQLATEIDSARPLDTTLASAIRLYILRDLQSRL